MSKHLYEFGPFRIDLNERLLLRDGQPVPLTPKAFETLLVLVQNYGHVVEKDELMNKVWPDTFVEEVGLARNISALRKLLEGGSDQHQYIETIPKRGYRFRAEVRVCEEGGSDPPAEKTQSPEVFHRIGSGPAAGQPGARVACIPRFLCAWGEDLEPQPGGRLFGHHGKRTAAASCPTPHLGYSIAGTLERGRRWLVAGRHETSGGGTYGSSSHQLSRQGAGALVFT